MAIQIVDVRPDLESVDPWKRRGVDARSGHHDHAKLRNATLRLWKSRDDAPQQMATNSRTADRHDAYTLVRRVAKRVAQRWTVGNLRRREAADVSREGVVRLGPFSDPRKTGTKA